MAWAASDKAKIAKYLGYPYTSVGLQQIQDKQDALTALSSDCVDHCTAYLTRLDAIAAAIDSNSTENKAGVASRLVAANEPVDYLAGEPLGTLREEGTRYLGLLADALDLILYRNWFAPLAVKTSSNKPRA